MHHLLYDSADVLTRKLFKCYSSNVCLSDDSFLPRNISRPSRKYLLLCIDVVDLESAEVKNALYRGEP